MDNLDELLEIKKSLVEHIHDNTLKQSRALEKEDLPMLNRLLIKREVLIGELVGINGRIKQQDNMMPPRSMEEDARMRKKLHEICRESGKNAQKAREVLDGFDKRLQHIALGRRTVSEGYLSIVPGTRGSYIDRKIGRNPKGRAYRP